MDRKALGFKERVSKRNEILLKYTEKYNLEEININMNISKFLKEHKLTNIKINYKK